MRGEAVMNRGRNWPVLRGQHFFEGLAWLDRSRVAACGATLPSARISTREVVEDVAARTGGVPLFVEELTAAPGTWRLST